MTFGTGIASAQERPASGGIFFNPLGLLLGQVGAEVGIGLASSTSLNLGAVYYSRNQDGVDNTAYGFSAGAQFFPTSRGYLYQGFFVYPIMQYVTAKASTTVFDEKLEAEASLVAAGALVGYQWDWRPFSLRLGGGLAYYSIVGESGDDVSTALDGVAPMLDASLGFTF